jgi:glycosyltransferase involved in cell wall biosynthesis
MRILQVNKFYYPWIGGIETVAQDIAEDFNAERDFSVTNLVCQPRGPRTMESVNGVPTWRAGSWGIIFSMPISFDFFRLFRKLSAEADVIILHHPFPLAFIAYWLFGKKKRVVVWYHSDIVRQRITKLPFMPFIRYALRRADHILVSNDAIIKTSSLLAAYLNKCHVVYFGIDVKRFFETEEIKKKAAVLRVKYGTPLVLSVGRLVYYKGYQYLIDAMKNAPDAHALIVGSGPLRGELMRRIEKNGLEDRVHIIDPVDDLVPYYHSCDVFALPSCEPSEVFGMVQVEAMACGKPVVNTALPTGVPEVSIDGITGKTVPPNDAVAFAAALREILGDKGKYSKFSANAIADVAKRFTKERFFTKMREYI